MKHELSKINNNLRQGFQEKIIRECLHSECLLSIIIIIKNYIKLKQNSKLKLLSNVIIISSYIVMGGTEIHCVTVHVCTCTQYAVLRGIEPAT